MTQTEPPTGAPRASSSVLYAELTSLRQQEGVTLRKLRDESPALCSTPATLDQLRRRGYAVDDRHLAALDVLRCAIERLVLRTDFAEILRETLQVHEYSASGERRLNSPTSLTERRLRLLGQLSLTLKQLRRLEEDAYVELAGALARLSSSPCPDEADWLQAFEQSGGDVNFTINVKGDRGELTQLLKLLLIETRPVSREGLAQAVLKHLDNARSALDGRSLLALGRLELLVRALLQELWPPTWAGQSSDHVGPDRLLTAANLYDHLLGEPLDRLRTRERIFRVEVSRYNARLEDASDRERRAFVFDDLLRDSLEALVDVVLTVERASGWAELLGGSAPADLRTR